MYPDNVKAKPPKSQSRSFRLSTNLLEELEAEASRKRVSTNTLVSQLLSAHIDYGRHVAKLGMGTLPTQTMVELMVAVDRESLIKIARHGGETIPKAYCLEKYGVYTLENFLKFISEFSSYSGYFESSVIENEGKSIVTLTHRLPRAGSIFYGEYGKRAFELLGIPVKLELSDHSVTFEF